MRSIPLSRGPIAAAVVAGAALLAVAGPASAVSIIGLTTDNALTTFDSATPTNASAPTFITGLEGINQRILGIDLRPTTGVIYGISSDSKLYTLNASTGAATKVANLAVGLNGVSFGIDFNPVADLSGAASLRVTSDTGQNLAVRVATSGANTAGSVTVQTPLTSGGNPSSAVAAAYSNNDVDPATGTTLYYINSDTDMLYSTTAPAAGVLSPVGALGVDATGVAGFDIAGVGNAAFAALSIDGTGKSALYSINLATGAATSLGAFGIGGNTVIAPQLLGLTVAAVPEPETYALMMAGLALVAGVARRRAA